MSLVMSRVMSSRQRLILLVATACCAALLLCPLGTGTTSGLRPLTSAAPPLFDAAAPQADNPDMDALRHEASVALGQLRGGRP